ncbi:MAG: ABC transporter permease [Flavobacteriia bacterium]|nr:ABC transporter permease [Flavobacteriia bacterium]
MLSKLFSQIGQSLLVAFGVVTVVFFLFSVLPGDPARMMMGQQEDSELMEVIYKRYGFDKPLGQQYLYYLNDLSPISLHPESGFGQWDADMYSGKAITEIGGWTLALKWPYLRQSFQRSGVSVGRILGGVLPNTLLLACSAILIAILLGIPTGLLAARFKDGALDRALVLLSSLGMSLPSFFSAILIAWLFGFVWHEWTGLEMNGSLHEMDDYGENVRIRWKNLILPALTLGIRPLGVITQLTRGSVLEVLQLDYIRTARSKGIEEWRVFLLHALPNALTPVVTAISGWFASMLAGAVFVEYIFGWNGLGKALVEALNLMDLPVVMGAVLIIGLLFVLVNIAVDLTYALIDPRLRSK